MGLQNKEVNIEFKWSDNMQEDGNIMDFWLSGDAAPCGRFNYVYMEAEPKALKPALKESLKGMVAFKVQSNFAYISGRKTSVLDNNSTITPIKLENEIFLPIKFVEKALGAKVEWNERKQAVTIKTKSGTIRMIINDNNIRFDGKLIILPNSAKKIGDTVYIPLNTIIKVYNKKMVNNDEDIVIFSDNSIDQRLCNDLSNYFNRGDSK